MVVISRRGRSVEIVNLLAKARESGAIVVGITISEDGLAQVAQIPIIVPNRARSRYSVNSYSCLAAAAGALAKPPPGSLTQRLWPRSRTVVRAAAGVLPKWQAQISHSAWPNRGQFPTFWVELAASELATSGAGKGLARSHPEGSGQCFLTSPAFNKIFAPPGRALNEPEIVLEAGTRQPSTYP